MRKITDIYEEYNIMPILSIHQLRVAAVAWQICESLTIEVDKNSIIKACLLHDMGNVIKFDLDQTKLIFGLSDVEVKDIKKIKDEFIIKYGLNEEEANVKIAHELGMHEKIVSLISRNGFRKLCIVKKSKDLGSQILQYSDLRVGPNGVLSYEGRMDEAGKRYRNHKNRISEFDRNKLVVCGKDIERELFVHSSIKPEDISDESIAKDIELLKDFQI